MSRQARRDHLRQRAFLGSLRSVLETLPSGPERAELDASFKTLIDFLTGLRDNLRNLPTPDEGTNVAEALRKLETLYDRASSNPITASALGLRHATRQRYGGASKIDETRIKAIAANLQTLPVEAIREELQGEKYLVAELRGVASELGIASSTKLNRNALAHQIAMKIANYRGYKSLSGQIEDDQLTDK
jgi:hypothetical protein